MGESSEQADGGSVATATLARMAIVAATLILAGVLGEKLIPQKVGTAYSTRFKFTRRKGAGGHEFIDVRSPYARGNERRRVRGTYV
jgi:hypothetical protein